MGTEAKDRRGGLEAWQDAEAMAATGATMKLRTASEALELSVADRSWSKIDKILEILSNYRRSLNLTGAGGRDGLEAHAVEALVAVRAALEADGGSGAWLDVGSGGGFPGLVAGAIWEGPVTLVEPRAKRAAFLELAVASAGLNAVVRRARLASGECVVLDAGGPIQPGFSVASARAVFSPRAWICECAYWVRAGGVCLVHGRSAGDEADLGGRQRARAIYGEWQVTAVVPRETPRIP